LKKSKNFLKTLKIPKKKPVVSQILLVGLELCMYVKML